MLKSKRSIESRLSRDIIAMREWYPQFQLLTPPASRMCWIGPIRPFRTLIQSFTVAFVYGDTALVVPKIWALSPEISKRTHPTHRHLNRDGSLCTFFVPDQSFDPAVHDVSILADLTSDWLRRFIFESRFGGWPGEEAPHEPQFVLQELASKAAAACVCGSGRTFRGCCKRVYELAARATVNTDANDLRTRAYPAMHNAVRAAMNPIDFAELTPELGPPIGLLQLANGMRL